MVHLLPWETRVLRTLANTSDWKTPTNIVLELATVSPFRSRVAQVVIGGITRRTVTRHLERLVLLSCVDRMSHTKGECKYKISALGLAVLAKH